MKKWLDQYQSGREVKYNVPIGDNLQYRMPVIISKQEMFNNLVGQPKYYEFNSDPNADTPGRRAISEEYATKYKTKKRLKSAAKVADVATDVMQLGNFIPLPQAQAIGKLGNVLGTNIDAFQGGMDVAEGNYGSAGINFASAFLPKVIENYGYKRDMFNTTPGSYADKIANLGSRSGEYIHLTPYIQHINNPAIMKGVNFNRGLLGALGSETAIDLNQKENGGLVSKNSLNRKVTCSNCGWSWKLSDGGLDPMTCHKCGGDIKMKEGGELDEYQIKGEYRGQVPTSDVMQNRVPIGMQQIPTDPFTGQPLTREQIQMQRFVPYSNKPQPIISQGTWKGNRTTKDNSFDPYLRIIEQDPESEANIGKRMRKDFITKKIPAGLTAAAGIMAAPLAAPMIGATMEAPIAGVAGLTGSNILNAGFATHGLQSVLSGDVAKPWKQAYKSGNGWDYANAVADNVMTGMELFPLVGPAYKGALGAFNYLNKQSTPYILSNRFNKLIKNTDLSKLNNFTEQSLIPRLDLLDKSSIGVNSDINELYKNNPEKYNELINHLFNENGDLYLRPIIRFKNTQPHSYIENLTLPSKNKTLFKEKMCPPESECAKTANSVNNYLFKEITGKPFDYNANAHNAWHMEDQMIKHGGKNVTSNVIIGDRLLMGNGVDQSTYVPGMIADPNIRHAGVYAGDILHNGSRFPMVMESGKNNPLYLNPINYTFTGENTVLKAIRPSQHNNSDYLKSLVEKNMRYAYRNKPSIYNSFSFNKDVQNIISKINTHRDEIKNTYDLTNDEFDALRNSLIGIGAQETKLGTTLPGSIASKAKIQLQDILVNTGLSAPIKQVKGNVGKVLNKLNQSSSELLSYPGSAYIEKEAAILSQNSNRSFEESLAIVKNKYQPKPKFSENTTSPSKGIFRQKFQTDLDKLADVNSNDEMRNAMGQMALNYQKAKKLYPEASPSQLVDITTLMWNSPGKAVNKELTDFYLFGNKNPNPLKFKFDYIDKVNKYKNKLIENPINKHGLEKHFEIFNEEGPEIYYKNGGPIVTNRGQWDYPGQTTIIPSNEITMRGVNGPLYLQPNKGKGRLAYPNEEHYFPKASFVVEHPIKWQIIED